MKPCCCPDVHGHGFVPVVIGSTGGIELCCQACGYWMLDLVEDGECSMCGEKHPEATCDWSEGGDS